MQTRLVVTFTLDVNASTSHDDANEDEYSYDTQSTQMMKDHLEVAKAAADVLHVSLGAIEVVKTLIETQHHHVLVGNNKFSIITWLEVTTGASEVANHCSNPVDYVD